MREKLKWGVASYDVFNGEELMISKRQTACFSEFMSRFKEPYTMIRVLDMDCAETFEFRDFYLQYVIDMFELDASFNEEYFEFKSLGVLMKDAAVLTVLRFLWECIGGGKIDTPNLFFRRLRDEESPIEDKLEKFCEFYKDLDVGGKTYFSEGHSWAPNRTKIKNIQHFKNKVKWNSVNEFFTNP